MGSLTIDVQFSHASTNQSSSRGGWGGGEGRVTAGPFITELVEHSKINYSKLQRDDLL